jgi:hypothetical protein
MTGASATQTASTFNVTGNINAKITFQVAGGMRTDIASDTDPSIPQTNYPTVVSDLTPSAATPKAPSPPPALAPKEPPVSPENS